MAGLESFMVVTNPTRGGRRQYKRIRLNAPKKTRAKRTGPKKPRTPAQRKATAKMLMARGYSTAEANRKAGVSTAAAKKKTAKKSTKGRARKKTTTRKKKTTTRRNSMARRRMPPRIKAGPRKGQFRKRKKAARKSTRKTARRKSARKNTGTAARRRAALKGARTRKRKAAKRSAAAKKAARTRKRGTRRNVRRPVRRRRTRALARRRRNPVKMLKYGTRPKTRRGKRGVATLRRARAYLRGSSGVGTTAAKFAAKYGMTSRNNPFRRRRRNRRASSGGAGKLSLANFQKMLPTFAWGLGGVVGTSFIGGVIGPYVPIGGALSPVITSTIGLGATWLLTSKVAMLKKHQKAILIGAGIGWAITALRTFLPGVAARLGIAPLVNGGLSGYWAPGVSPIGPRGLSDYVRSGVLEGEYVPTGTSTLGAYVEEPMSGLGAYYQDVAGLGGLGINVQEAIAGLGIDVFPVAQNGCQNCSRGSVVPMSAVPPASAAFPLAAREAALQKAGQITKDIAVRPPREMLGMNENCGIFGASIYSR